MAPHSSPAPIVVEQLNRSQWHALIPGHSGKGVTNWVDAMSYALLVGELEGFSVVSQCWQGDRLVMMQAREAAR